jgi:hypothetical protein
MWQVDLGTSFRDDGFAILPDLLAQEEKAELARYADDIARWPEAPRRWMQYFEHNIHTQARQLCLVENFLPYHDGLEDILNDGRIEAAVSALLGEPAVLYRDRLNLKLPGGHGFAPHQDAPSLCEHGPGRLVTALIAVDRCTRDNGCLELMAEGRGLGLLPHTAPGGAIPDELVRRMNFRALTVEPGDVVIFDADIPHRSGPNCSASPRRAFYLTYTTARAGDHRAAYFRDKRESFPPECERMPGRDYTEGARRYHLAEPVR